MYSAGHDAAFQTDTTADAAAVGRERRRGEVLDGMTEKRRHDLDDDTLVPLVMKARDGDRDAWSELQRLCSPLVDAKVRRNYNADAQEDMRQAGLVGLWEAVLRYDPDHPSGKSFATVATYRIAYAIENYVAEMGGSLSVPRTQFNKVRRILQAIEDYVTANPGAPDPEDAFSDEDLDALTGVKDSRATLAAVGLVETLDHEDRPEFAFLPSTPSVEDELLDSETARDLDVIETSIAIMDAHGDPRRQRELAYEVADRWGLGREIAEKILVAARNRTRSWAAKEAV